VCVCVFWIDKIQ